MKNLSHPIFALSVTLVLLSASCTDERRSPTGSTEFTSAEPAGFSSPIDAALSQKPLPTAPLCKVSTNRGIAPMSLTAIALYAVTDLGTLGGAFSAALDINASGQIVGSATIASGALHPFLYANGQMTDLGTLGGSDGIASGINDAGEIVGQADNTQNVRRAFVYRNGVMSDLGTLGGTESRGSDINNSGKMVGSASTPTARHAFLYENGQMFDLGTLGGTTSWANQINAAGVIVGGSHAPPDERWRPYVRSGSIMTDLGTLGGRQGVAFSINDVGQIAGWSEPAVGEPFRATLWSNAAIIDLGTLGGESITYAINSSGQIVGHSYSVDNRLHAFIINGGAMQDLNELIPANSGWELEIATEINEDGRKIVGRGIINGQRHAFLLTASPSLAIGGLIDLIFSFRLARGMETALTTKLQQARDLVDAGDVEGACGVLDEFIELVQSQSGKKKLPVEIANQLMTSANQIKELLGCD